MFERSLPVAPAQAIELAKSLLQVVISQQPVRKAPFAEQRTESG